MIDKYHITELELRHSRTHSNHSVEGQSDTPSPDVLLTYVSRFQNSHRDYQPMDVDSIKWLTESLSSSQLLSLGPDSCPSAMSFSNTVLRYLQPLGNIIKFGKRKYGNNQLNETLLFTKMKWIEQFNYPRDARHAWFDVSFILHDAQSEIPNDDYLKHSERYDEWFNVVHCSWQYLFKEVRNHLFFRKFRKNEDIPRFQHSVHWTIFFYRFQTDKDSESPHVVELKNKILFDSKFRNAIRAFIDAVETALDTVKPVKFSNITVSAHGIALDRDLNREIDEILHSIKVSNKYERWLTTIFLRSTDLWTITLIAAADGAHVPFPKEIVAAKMLWGVEAIVAYIEPIVFRRRGDVHLSLLSFRNRMRFFIHRLILKDSWISYV